MASRLISIKEAAERLSVSPNTVRTMIAAGALQAYRVGTTGRLIRVSVDQIENELLTPIRPGGGAA